MLWIWLKKVLIATGVAGAVAAYGWGAVRSAEPADLRKLETVNDAMSGLLEASKPPAEKAKSTPAAGTPIPPPGKARSSPGTSQSSVRETASVSASSGTAASAAPTPAAPQPGHKGGGGTQTMQTTQTTQSTQSTQTTPSSSSASPAASASKSAEGKLDLNRATLQELDGLPGIGPGKAKAIIEYRDKHGGFRNVRELNSVKGIGDKTFAELEPLVAVTGNGGD